MRRMILVLAMLAACRGGGPKLLDSGDSVQPDTEADTDTDADSDADSRRVARSRPLADCAQQHGEGLVRPGTRDPQAHSRA